MSVYAGVDLSTKQIDIVLLEEDTNLARHARCRLDLTPGDATTRIRRIRDALPPRTDWTDQGVLGVAIEEPFNRATMGGQVPILMAVGGVLQMIPVTVTVALLRADDWRRACDLPIRGDRQKLKRAAIEFARRNWANRPTTLDDNAADAFGLAYAMRSLAEKHARTAA